MAKKYNLGNSSDMRKFNRDLEKEMKKKYTKSLNAMSLDIECPNCGAEFKGKSGLNHCPSCNEEINLTLKFDF